MATTTTTPLIILMLVLVVVTRKGARQSCLQLGMVRVDPIGRPHHGAAHLEFCLPLALHKTLAPQGTYSWHSWLVTKACRK